MDNRGLQKARERESKKRKLTVSDEQVDEGLNVDVEEKMLSHD